MKLKIILFSLFCTALAMLSCNRDEISFEEPSQLLRFSKDTVFCDTVYHQVRSESYAVKVYNQEDKDVMIPKIELGFGAASNYRINVDGKSGYSFTNIPLRRNDSLYIFIEIAPTAHGTESIAEDRILFTSGAGPQHVTLFSVVQDAEFFIQSSTSPNILTGNNVWDSNKVKIIYGDLTLDQNATLDIMPGTKVYFFKNSGMKVRNGATLNVMGSFGNEVIMRGDRNETYYDTIPKNWNSMLFEAGSALNMNYARVFGGIRGIDLRESTATIKNSIIHTFDEYGIHAVNATLNAENLVMNNSAKADLGIFKGGNYNIVHSTLANYWREKYSLGDGEALFATNRWQNGSGQTEFGDLTLNIRNSILYTYTPNAVRFDPVSGQQFDYQIQNSLLKYSSGAGFSFDSNPNIVSSWQNQDPKFEKHYTHEMNLRVKSDSPAKAKGDLTVAASVPLDIAQIARTTSPTLGAYQ